MTTKARAQHTPGPWAVGKGGMHVYYLNPRIEAGEDIEDPQHDSVICRIAEDAFGTPDRDAAFANARLIAQAPRMLALLIELAAPGNQSLHPADKDRARAILRDVEGE